MKKLIVFVVVLCLLLTGCSWLDGAYHSVTPHASDNSAHVQSGITVSSIAEIREALSSMVNNGSSGGTLYMQGIIHENVNAFMNAAIAQVKTNTALGAYAVDAINYESGTIGGREAVAVDITYLHFRPELMRIKRVRTMNNLKKLIENALVACDPSVVIMVSEYENVDIVQFAQDFTDRNSHQCMEVPQVTATIYPDSGKERIVEVSFTYENSREVLRNMQDTVTPIFTAAKMYVQGSEDAQQKCEQLYSFLMERFDYQIDTSITPTYSLLRHGVGDSKAFASVYSIMCRNSGIPCEVVLGTRDGEARYWNYLKIDDTYYHLDLLTSQALGGFTLFTSDMLEGYVWDYSQFP